MVLKIPTKLLRIIVCTYTIQQTPVRISGQRLILLHRYKMSNGNRTVTSPTLSGISASDLLIQTKHTPQTNIKTTYSKPSLAKISFLLHTEKKQLDVTLTRNNESVFEAKGDPTFTSKYAEHGKLYSDHIVNRTTLQGFPMTTTCKFESIFPFKSADREN